MTRADLLVIVIVALTLLGILVVAIPRTHEDSNRVQCGFNLKRLGDGIRRFSDRIGSLPPSRIAPAYATWAVLIVPDVFHLKDSPLKGWDLQQSFYAQPAEVRQMQVATYFCPARRHPPQNSIAGDVPGGKEGGELYSGALGDYAAVAGNGVAQPWDGEDANGPLVQGEVLRREGDRILKWRSQTSFKLLAKRESYVALLGEKHVPRGQFGEVRAGDGSLYNGEFPGSFSRIGGPGFGLARSPDAPYNRNFGSYHLDVCQFLMADGAVKPLTPALEETVLGRLTTLSPPEK
jgi:hypothetical protein